MRRRTTRSCSGWEKVHAFLPEPLSSECRHSIARIARRDDVVHIALMPDLHLAEQVCVGAVVASRSCLYPQAVGGDIGCGVAAMRLRGDLGALGTEQAASVLEESLGWSPEAETARDMVHNRLRLEEHAGELMWVHRKGSSSARHNEPGVIPGSMGSPSYLVTGRGDPRALCSSSHGAGRVLSRNAAELRISAGALLQEMQGIFFDERRAAQLVSEAPSAYKTISQMMRAQKALVRIESKLTPVLNYKAG